MSVKANMARSKKDARLKKFAVVKDGAEVPYPDADIYGIERVEGGERLAIAVRSGHVDLLRDLAICLEPPLSVLYVLIVPRGGGACGRYKSPPVDLEDVESFLSLFLEFFESDGRHNVWVGSGDGRGTVVYDRHSIIYAYGGLDRYRRVLEARGLKETTGAIGLASLHRHSFHAEFDCVQAEVLAHWNWERSDIVPGQDEWSG